MRCNRGALLLLVVLAGCAGQPARQAARPAPAAPAASPGVKIGQPYQVMGKWYYPADDRGYDATGIASWYGPGFHALVTANGETYDQDAVTAAHKTLPMPSYVEVTNLDNGRVLIVRVNDRGPFVDGRIIDLSRRSAQLLGVDQVGLAKVRVRRVYPDAATVAALAPRAAVAEVAAPIATAGFEAAAPVAPVTTVPLPASTPASSAAPPAASLPASPAVSAVFIQVAALADAGKAEWLAGYLRPMAPSFTEKTGAGLWRVRLGPFASPDAAAATLAQVQAAGYTEARVVAAAPANPGPPK